MVVPMVAVVAALAVAILLGAFGLFRRFGEMLRHAGKLGGPPAYPLIGNGLLFLNKTPAEFLRTIEWLLKKYGNSFRVWLGTQLVILVQDPKDIEALLGSPKYIDKSTEYDFIRPWLGEGLLTSRGRKWHTHRKVITPTFHFKILEQFVEIFDRQSSTFVKVLQPYAEAGKSFDIFPQVTLCALDVICESAMGTKVDAQLNSTSSYVLAVKEITNLIQLRFYDFLIRYDFFFRLSANSRKQKKVIKALHNYTDSVIRGRRQQLEQRATGGSDAGESVGDQDFGIKKRMAFLDMLLQATVDWRPLTDLEIREEVDTFMFEGHDTTTSAISFLLQSLAKNPDVQQKVFEEVRSIVGDDRSQPITLAMLNDMSYLDLVIKETLRLFPSVPMIGRKMLQTTEIIRSGAVQRGTVGREDEPVPVHSVQCGPTELHRSIVDAMFLTVVAGLAIAVAVYVYLAKFSNSLKYSGKLGGPPAYPLIGNGLLFINNTPADFLPTVGRLLQQYGNCVRIWLGTQLLIVILSSNKYIDKSIEYNFIKPWLGEGLLTSTGRKWFAHRKVITPTFHFKILEQFIEIFDQQSSTFVEVLKPYAESGKSFDIFGPVTLCALDVICETAMGTKVNAQLNSDSKYVQAVKEITALVQVRLFHFLIRYDFFYRFSDNRRKTQEALKVLHGYTDSVIRSRREELNRAAQRGGTEIDENANDLGIKKKVAFLDMLLQSKIDGQPLTDLEIREEVDTFMFEGHDTTTSAISFLLQCLAKNPDVQQKVFDEIRSIVGDDRKQPVTMAMLNDMNYLDLVIKETLRLNPSVPMIGRKMMENSNINGKIFPAGSNIIIMPFFLGRDPKNFPNPEKFDPERFNVERSAEKMNPYQYIPFSAGPRNCIGQKFAVAEIKSLVSKVLRNYEILPALGEHKESYVSELILRPGNGVFVRLQPRVY
ncbi:AGAP013241-PA-like protein [Anopheles sinensis]|uniref:AGAP013241-PA-like protein n=1 Tax=Anopheles sinensis TaxID=74873 RepID=A0A084VSF1_ANOSI|nr:AGAP013241-PA-like protein [Anopheles sinensis]